MNITVLKEAGIETRVSIAPKHIHKLQQLNLNVQVENGAGVMAGFFDKSYELEQVVLSSKRKKILDNTSILPMVNTPDPYDLKGLNAGSLLITTVFNDHQNPLIQWALKHQISLISVNDIPRISRSQSMDVLTSQASLAGYGAVLEGIRLFNRVVPMMMTAAGMIKPAKVLILGAGVAGLQAIATAKRIGAEVYAFDVRPSVKEQVESLGAKFIEVDDAIQEQKSGYASEMTASYQKKQAALIDEIAQKSDIIITTALIPGKKAPTLILAKTVEKMKEGSVIIDLATSSGGNCELSVSDKIVQHERITIYGISHAARLIPATASELFSSNIVHLLKLIVSPEGQLVLDTDDEIVKQSLICHAGQYQPFKFVEN